MGKKALIKIEEEIEVDEKRHFFCSKECAYLDTSLYLWTESDEKYCQLFKCNISSELERCKGCVENESDENI